MWTITDGWDGERVREMVLKLCSKNKVTHPEAIGDVLATVALYLPRYDRSKCSPSTYVYQYTTFAIRGQRTKMAKDLTRRDQFLGERVDSATTLRWEDGHAPEGLGTLDDMVDQGGDMASQVDTKVMVRDIVDRMEPGLAHAFVSLVLDGEAPHEASRELGMSKGQKHWMIRHTLQPLFREAC